MFLRGGREGLGRGAGLPGLRLGGDLDPKCRHLKPPLLYRNVKLLSLPGRGGGGNDTRRLRLWSLALRPAPVGQRAPLSQSHPPMEAGPCGVQTGLPRGSPCPICSEKQTRSCRAECGPRFTWEAESRVGKGRIHTGPRPLRCRGLAGPPPVPHAVAGAVTWPPGVLNGGERQVW